MNKSALSTHSHTFFFCEIDSHLKSPKIEEKKYLISFMRLDVCMEYSHSHMKDTCFVKKREKK